MGFIVWRRRHKETDPCPFLRKSLTGNLGQLDTRIWISDMDVLFILTCHHIVVEQFPFLKHMRHKGKGQIWQVKKRHIRLNCSRLKTNLLCHLDQAQSRRPIHGRLSQFSQVSQRIVTTVVAKYHSQGSHATIHLIHLGTIVPFPKFHIHLLFSNNLLKTL